MNATKKPPPSPLLHLLPPGAGGDGIFPNRFPETMPRRAASTALIFLFLSMFLLASSSLYYFNCRSTIFAPVLIANTSMPNNVIKEEEFQIQIQNQTLTSDINRNYDSVLVVETVAVLFPDWEVLLIVSLDGPPPPTPEIYNFTCLYFNKATAPARPSRVLPSTNQITFKCEFPKSVRHRLPFSSPILVARRINRGGEAAFPPPPPRKEIVMWSFLAYESVSTDHDVVLFVKGVNNRQGINRSPKDLRCVFYYAAGENGNVSIIKTEVTSSEQEVFRCNHPKISYNYKMTKISLEILDDKKPNLIVPSVAYYAPLIPRGIENSQEKSLICAATMVYNTAKFLKEWVTYHASIGVDKFILYDNESEDDLNGVVDGLNKESGLKVETAFWIWPKAQEAGFSHAALTYNDSCTWMMFLDVDEFVSSPSWINITQPNGFLLESLLPHHPFGEVWIKCYEFGPSNQSSHPVEGVTQGYTCRRKMDNRHKSIVSLNAVDPSLNNAIHHFKLRKGYRTKHVGLESAVVNHYKYQAWSEFRAKFRRRVSAYVVDWTKSYNPSSQDRAPGLGFEPIEPPGWAHKFCEVMDERLKDLTRKWFGRDTGAGFQMAWQR